MMFERFLTALESVALGLWVGALAGFAFLTAPTAIRIVTPLGTFAGLVSAVIRALGLFGWVCGGIAAGAAALRAVARPARPLAIARICFVISAIGASSYETAVIVPRMEATARRIPCQIDSVPKDDPRRADYAADHAASSRVYGVAFLCALVALGLAPFGRRHSPGDGDGHTA